MAFKANTDPDPRTPMKVRWLKKNGRIAGHLVEVNNGTVWIYPLGAPEIIVDSWVDAAFVVRDQGLADEWTDENE